MAPRSRSHADLDAGSPPQALLVKLSWFDQPGLPRVEVAERSSQRCFGGANDRSDITRQFISCAYAQGRDGVGELMEKLRVVINGAFDDRQAGRAALLTGVAEGRVHEVFDREIDVRA